MHCYGQALFSTTKRVSPCPCRWEAQSHTRTTYEDISITAADESGRRGKSMDAKSNQRLASVYGQFDQLAQQVAEMINNDEYESPLDEAMEIEDFEVEVSASDDSGDEYDENKEHSTSVQTRQESTEFEDKKMVASKEPLESPLLSPHRHTRKTYHGLPTSPSSLVSSRYSPISPHSPVQMSEPSPPPLPPRLNRSYHDNRDLPPRLPSSPSPDPSRRSPLPPRPPKPYLEHKRHAAGPMPVPTTKESTFHMESRSMSDTALQEWNRAGSLGELDAKTDIPSTANPVVALPTPAVDQLGTSPSGRHKATA